MVFITLNLLSEGVWRLSRELTRSQIDQTDALLLKKSATRQITQVALAEWLTRCPANVYVSAVRQARHCPLDAQVRILQATTFAFMFNIRFIFLIEMSCKSHLI